MATSHTHSIKSMVPGWLKRLLIGAEAAGYRATLAALMPVNHLIARLLARKVPREAVLHVSVMVHVPYYTVRILREHGVCADYLAVGDSPWWNDADYHYRPTRWPLASVLKEMWWVWRVVSRYDIIHSHFMVTLTRTGWEWPILKKMGRAIIVHYRGCEIRDRERNQRLHPEMNICEECDYRPYLCETPINVHRRRLAAECGSAFLVTTPDLKDFVPSAQHLPFLVMTVPRAAGGADPCATGKDSSSGLRKPAGAPFKIVHATNHPGIEGSRHIRRAVEALIAKGFAIDYVELNAVTHDRVLAELADADLSIGKMKMGYYANLQIESMVAGVPTVTYVRPEFMTDELRDSGFIFATLNTLELVLEHYISDPDALAAKQEKARSSVLKLHDNAVIAAEYRAVYAKARAARPGND